MSASKHQVLDSGRRARAAIRGATLIAVLAAAVVMAPAPARATEVLGVVYRTTPSVAIKLDVYTPSSGSGPFPGAVLVHGGNWRDGWRGDVADTARELANRGVVAFAIDFRMPCDPTKIEPGVDPNLCSPSYAFPVPAQDVGYAVAWVRQRGSLYNAIPGRAGIVGPSSGGNLAMEVGALGTAGRSQPDAIVSWSGIGDLTWHRQNGAAQRRNYIGCSYPSCPDKWVQASPSLEVGTGDAPL
ncbi:MAG TPA: alpha/beta hydrolase, partial [Actinomycetota bacterium]|nr:alpha/beta hydrolase [Actinomycetota bacterium]